MKLVLKSGGAFRYENLLDTPFDEFEWMIEETNNHNKEANKS